MAAAWIGRWRADHEIWPDGSPRLLPAHQIDQLVFRSDGTAEWRFLHPRFPDLGRSPVPETWEVREPGTISIWIPIGPMPKYGIDEWTREERRYAIVAVNADTLTLSTQPADEESVVVHKRVGDK